MKCKFCGEELPERGNFCPVCGRDNSPEEENLSQPTEEIVLQEEEFDVEPEQQDEVEAALPEINKMKRTAIISGCIAVLAVLALVLFFGIRSSINQGDEGSSLSGLFDWELFRENDIFKQDSYTVEDKKAVNKADQVVATIGDAKLTNGQLQIYYQMEVIEFISQYSYYLSYFGLDYTKPLDQQECIMMEGYTWQQFFLESALSSWQQSQILAMEAKKNNFQMDSTYQEKLDAVDKDMATTATQSGFASADAFLQSQCGINTDMDDYKAYMELYFNGYLYFAQLSQAIEVPSDEALADYFAANKEELEANGIKQDGSYTVDVRHILIGVEGGTENADGTIIFPDEALAAEAYAKAQDILNQWLENPTEENFGALAKEHTADGNGDAGGLYTDVAAGRMVASFNDWCFDAARQPGDYGIVTTKFGYHIMFFSARGEETWLTNTRDYYRSQQEMNILEELIQQNEMNVSYSKIALAHVDLG